MPASIAVDSRAVPTVVQHIIRAMQIAGFELDAELVRTAALKFSTMDDHQVVLTFDKKNL